jgi:hypothetical protein
MSWFPASTVNSQQQEKRRSSMSKDLYPDIAFIRAKAGKTEELGKELVALVEPTRREEGNYAYDLHRSGDDPNLWFIYEAWRSKKDLDLRHFVPVAAKPAAGK